MFNVRSGFEADVGLATILAATGIPVANTLGLYQQWGGLKSSLKSLPQLDPPHC